MPQAKKRSRISRSDFEKIVRSVSFSDEAIATYKKVSPERAAYIRKVTTEAFKAIEDL